MSDAVRIAMWSGPRNISTAMLRSFGNRPDRFVTDEPLYAYYLAASGAPHPMSDAVIASQSTHWREVVDWLTGPVPGGKPVWYQKHITHHLLDEVGRDWLDRLSNCFLLRDPRAVLASYAKKRDERVRLEDVGMVQQAAIFDEHMLAWPPGRRETDGVWAAHWYQAVERSTGFEPYRPPPASLPDGLEALAEQCRPAYERLRAHALRPPGAS